MDESQKGTSSTADTKKKSSSLDEDFGDDFLSSWKPANMGKDAIDFDVGKDPPNKKKTFNFEKLDDFELGGDFGKLSSFKMNMPDLDFSSPLKKTEKPKGKSCEELNQGKKEPKQDKFSFTFDFNDLDKFDLNSNLLKGERKSSKCTDDNGSDRSINHDKNQESRSNSVTSTDVFEDNETKRLPISEIMDISRSEHLIEPNTVNRADPSTSSNYGHDVSREAATSTGKKMVVAEENKNESHSREGNNQRADRTSFMKPYAEKAKQDFCFQSGSGDSSAQETLPWFGAGFASLDHLKVNSARELDDTARSVDCSQSRNSSPAKTYDSRCWRGASIIESGNTSCESQKCPGNQNEITGGSTVLSESTEGQKDVVNTSNTNFSQKIACELKYTGDKQNSISKLLQSPLHRGSSLVNIMPEKEKATTGLQLKLLSKPANDVSQPTSVLTPKQLYSVDSGKMKTTNILPAIENRQSKRNDETEVENRKGGTLRSYGKSLAKDVPVITGSKKNDSNDTSCTSNLTGQTTASKTAKSILPILVSGTTPVQNSHKISLQRQGVSVKEEKINDPSSFKISGTTKLNINSSNPQMKEETKSVRFSERNLEFPLNTASKVSSSFVKEKYALLSPPLKRKTLEESRTDTGSINPLKRVMESTTESRKLLESSSKITRKVVPRTGNPEICQGSVSINNGTSNGIFKEGGVANFEVPILIENDGNVEKAEACAKELDDESRTDTGSINPLKRVMESTTESRKLLESSSKIARKVVPRTGNPEICQGSVSINNGTSNGIFKEGGVANFEVPILIENDGNVEKAEAFAKELDDICNMLRKKHEEAKELLVHTIVNNNMLLMLNHPMHEEKILALQKSLSILQFKEF